MSLRKKIGISKEEVEAKIEKLYLADLVYKSEFKYFAFNDICLMRFIQYAFENDISGVEKVDLSQMGKYNFLKGHFLEMVVQRTLEKFNDEEVEGRLFGKSGKVLAPRLDYVDARTVKGDTTRAYQIDAYGINNGTGLVWLCECKYRVAKMGMETVKKAEKALEAFKQQQIKEGRELGEIQLWLVSVGGFTDEVIAYIKDIDHIYYSDYEGINTLYKKYGGGFDIPLFCTE